MAKSPHSAIARNQRILSERARRMRNLRPPTENTAVYIREVTAAGFANSIEPYGRKFRKLKYRTPPPPPLDLTGEAKASVRVTVSGTGGLRFFAVEHLYYHMSGTRDGVVPKRNPTPFEFRDGAWRAKPPLMRKHQQNIKRWIEQGAL